MLLLIIDQIKVKKRINVNFWKGKEIPYIVQAYDQFRLNLSRFRVSSKLSCFQYEMRYQIKNIPVVNLGLSKQQDNVKLRFSQEGTRIYLHRWF